MGTTAVLCVGNTLLLNGTVHSPPYVVTALGADRNKFEADALVQRLRDGREELRAQVLGAQRRQRRDASPAYDGSTRTEVRTRPCG